MVARTWMSVLFLCLAVGRCGAKVIQDPPGATKKMESLAWVLQRKTDRPVHVLYIHGINSTGSDDSQVFRESICTELHLCDASTAWNRVGREYPDKGWFAPGHVPDLTYLGTRVWPAEAPDEWKASLPYVTHYVAKIGRFQNTMVVDEINWWPLMMKLKCQQIMTDDAYLAGPNDSIIGLCAKDQRFADDASRYEYYPWIKNQPALTKYPRRAARLNFDIKSGLEDWGLSDAMLGAAGLKELVEEAIRQLIVKAVQFDPRSAQAQAYNWQEHAGKARETDQEFIGVTHSLGSFLLLDTFEGTDKAGQTEEESAALQYVRERTVLMYFFANQVALLELANLKHLAESSQAESEGALIGKWQQVRKAYAATLKAGDPAARTDLQVVAFSDPSDLLTWRVRPEGGSKIVNLYVKNAFRWFGLVEGPTSAHDNYAKNRDVLRVMFGMAVRAQDAYKP